MILHLSGVLTGDQVDTCRSRLTDTHWSDGRGSAGYLSAAVKSNAQLPDNHPLARELGEIIIRALDGNARFTAAALPLKMVPPLFNCYENDAHYGSHIDGAIRPVTGTPYRVRTDLSATVFLSDPETYQGGELVIEDSNGPSEIKLAAGDMILYPGTSIHHVKPVTSGKRLAAFFWIQSMVRSDHHRTMLFELDNAIQKIAMDSPDQSALTNLAGVYHNLLREWADT